MGREVAAGESAIAPLLLVGGVSAIKGCNGMIEAGAE
jgi:hypothetical protein